MKLELSTRDAKTLSAHLSRRLVDLQNELTHTKDRQLHKDLAADVEELEQLVAKVSRFVDEAAVYA